MEPPVSEISSINDFTMHSCDHTALLQVAGDRNVVLYEFGRFEHVIRDLPSPREQYPRIIHFIGRKNKDAALKYIFPYNNLGRRLPKSTANLYLDNSTIASDNPVLFSESDPFCGIRAVPKQSNCHLANIHHLSWFPSADLSLNDILHVRLYFLLSNVVCVFVDDFPSLEGLATRICTWTSAGAASNLDRLTRPRLIVVVSEKSVPSETAELRFEQFRSTILATCGDAVNDVFSSIQVFQLGGDHLSSEAKYRRLKDTIMTQSADMLQMRAEKNVLFSATHTMAFFGYALKHMSMTANTEFDFLLASRCQLQANGDHARHLANFLRLGQIAKIADVELMAYIAATLIMDAYPPEMHLFDARRLFNKIYRLSCFDALQQCSYSTTLAHFYCSQIESVMVDHFHTLKEGHTDSSHIRADKLQLRSRLWSLLKSNQTCLCCLLRPPEHVLPCGHSLCNICIVVFGIETTATEHSFDIPVCIICDSEIEFAAMIKPPTAGVRVLSVDGGGTRGFISAEFICILQDILGDLPLWSMFDLSIGTSSGGLNVLGLQSLRWSPQQCSEVFEKLAHKLFGQKTPRSSLMSQLKSYVHCWLSDGAYDPKIFETYLKETFGISRRLFDMPHDHVSGPKFAVVTASISDATPFLLHNYDGVTRKDQYRGYESLRPENVEDEPDIWQAARATTAAPILYPTVRIGDSDYQDGALKHNNPCWLVRWETCRLWPYTKDPDVFLSIGTGVPTVVKQIHAPQFRNIFTDGFIPRFVRSISSKSEGEKMWDEFFNSLDEDKRQDYFRLNVPVSGSTAIDNVKAMAQSRTNVRQHMKASEIGRDIVRALLISCLYFELDTAPSFEAGRYYIQGTIKCRSNSFAIVNALQKADIHTLEYCTDTEVLSSSSSFGSDICALCHRYRRRIQFYIRHPGDVMCIYVRSNRFRRKLSAFPRCINWFKEQQGMLNFFGTVSHGSPGLLHCHACVNQTGPKQLPKRAIESASPPLPVGKRARV